MATPWEGDLAFLLVAIGGYALAYAAFGPLVQGIGVLASRTITDDFGKVWSYTIRSIGPVGVDLESGESVKKLDDVRCMFLP